MQTEFLAMIPVLPSADIARDGLWYKEKAGFEILFADNMYAGLRRGGVYVHLQWHAGTEEDPLTGGSVIRIEVKNIKPLFDELKGRGLVGQDVLKTNTPWNTTEFGFFDLNKNAVFIMEALP